MVLVLGAATSEPPARPHLEPTPFRRHAVGVSLLPWPTLPARGCPSSGSPEAGDGETDVAQSQWARERRPLEPEASASAGCVIRSWRRTRGSGESRAWLPLCSPPPSPSALLPCFVLCRGVHEKEREGKLLVINGSQKSPHFFPCPHNLDYSH